jgi:hypothetical protein
LGRFTAPVSTFNYEELPGETVIPVRNHSEHSITKVLK